MMGKMDTGRGYPHPYTLLIPSGTKRMMGKNLIGGRGYPTPLLLFKFR